MPRDMEQFGQRIKKKRKEKHLSQIEAAEKLGISPIHLSTLENGNSNPSFEVICDLCDLLDATPDYFFLGALHSNNLSQNIIDKLRLLPEDKQELNKIAARWPAKAVAQFFFLYIKKQWKPSPNSSIVKSPQPTIKQDRHYHCL